MIRKIVVSLSVCILLGTFASFAGEKNTTHNTGYALLENLMTELTKSIRPGNKPSDLEKIVDQLMAATQKARKTGTIDAVFSHRYAKMLSIVKLSRLKDPENLLWPLVEKTVGDYVESIEGKRPGDHFKKMYVDHGGQFGLAVIAGAVFNEVINLHIYLDTKEKRQTLLKTYLN